MRYNNVLSIIFFIVLLQLPFTANAVIEVTSVTPIANNISCDGAVNITAIGTAGPFTFEWTGPNGFMVSTEDLNGLCNPGVYVVKVIFADGSCYTTLTVSLIKCGSDFKPQLYITPSCTGLNNGRANVLNPIPGGVSPYSYLWSNGATTKEIQNLPAGGQYCVTVSDFNGCKSQPACYTVPEVQPISMVSIEASPPSPNCFGGPGKLKANVPNVPPPNWTDPPTYHWSTGDWGAEIYVSAIDYYDYYSVTVTSSICPGAATAGKFYINYRPMQIELTQSNSCGFPTDIFTSVGNGGGGPYTYLWNTGATTDAIAVTQIGTYTVSITSGQGCVGTSSIALPINQNRNVIGTITNPTNPCSNNGTILLNITGWQGPFQFSWNGPNGYNSNSQNIGNLNPGIYCVTITDDYACSDTKCFSLTSTTSVGISNVTNCKTSNNPNDPCIGAFSSCNGSISLLTTGIIPASYNWSNGSTSKNVSGLCQGTYTVTITYPGGCTRTLSAGICCCYVQSSISVPSCLNPCSLPPNQAPPTPIIISNFTAPQTNTSLDGIIDITMQGGTQAGGFYYNWTGPNGMISTNQDIKYVNPGLYCVTVTNGCNSTNTCIQLTACSNFTVSLASKINNCTEFTVGAININVSGGNTPYSYLWSNGATTKNLSGVIGGQYTVTVTDTGKCIKTLTATLLTLPPVITYSSNPCSRTARCGTFTNPPDIHPLQSTNYSDCNSYSLYCDYTNSIVGQSSDDIDAIYNSTTCEIQCGGSGGITKYGTHVVDKLSTDFETMKCFYGNGCEFLNIDIDGEHNETYFLPYIAATQYELMDLYGDDCPDQPDCCKIVYACRDQIVGESLCTCPDMNPPIHLPTEPAPPGQASEGCKFAFTSGDGSARTTVDTSSNVFSGKYTLLSYLKTYSIKTGTKKFGLHKQVNLGMSVEDYFNMIGQENQFPIKTFDISDLENYVLSNKILVYPNPFNDKIRIVLPKKLVTNPVEVKVSIYNNLGMLVYTEKFDSQNQQQINIDSLYFPAGPYHIIVEYESEFFQQIVIKATR